MASWFGFGGRSGAQDAADAGQPSAEHVAASSQFVVDEVSQPTTTPAQPMTVSDMLSGLPAAHAETLQKKLAPIADDEDVEFLYISDSPLGLPTSDASRPKGTFGPLPMRTNYDKLLYGVGTAYVAGLTFGGGYGALRGLRTAQVPTFKVRMNNLMNQSTRYGPWAANSMGIMTMGWALLDSAFEALRGGESDYYNHLGAAFTSGFIFKCTAGLRPAILTGSILASVVGTYGVVDQFRTHGLQGFNIPSFAGSRAQPAST